MRGRGVFLLLAASLPLSRACSLLGEGESACSLHPCATELSRCLHEAGRARGEEGECLMERYDTLPPACRAWLALARRTVGSAAPTVPLDPLLLSAAPYARLREERGAARAVHAEAGEGLRAWLLTLIEGAPLPLLLLAIAVLPLLVRPHPPPSSTLVSLPYAHPTDGPALSLSRALTAGDHRPRPLRRSRHLPVGPVAAVVMAEAEAAIAAPQQMWTREPRGRLTTCVCVCVCVCVWTQCGSSCVVLCCAYSSAAWCVCVCECCQGSEVRESLV